MTDYYARERIQIVCEVEITYKDGDSECRADALRAAGSIHHDVKGVGPHGCYSARLLVSLHSGRLVVGDTHG